MTIPVKGVEQLRRLAQRCGSSLFVTVLAAFKVLLRRYSGRDDLVVGTPSSGRNRPDLEGGLVGCFVNLTALRTDMTGSKLLLLLLQLIVLGLFCDALCIVNLTALRTDVTGSKLLLIVSWSVL